MHVRVWRAWPSLCLVRKSCLAVLFGALVGCSFHPLNIDDEHWQRMSFEERSRAYQQQAQIDQAQAERRAAEARLREAEYAEQQAQWLNQPMFEGFEGYGRGYAGQVQCVLSEAQAWLDGKWRSIEPLALRAETGRITRFDLRESGKHRSYEGSARAWFNGQTLALCPDRDGYTPNEGGCVQILGTERDFQRGLEQPIEERRFLRGRLRCDSPRRSYQHY